MIQSIQINNFQSHKYSVMELHKGVNVIIGPSDSGKTTILRALRWLVWNRPSGDAFRSDWGGETLVTVQLQNYKVDPVPALITRKKDKNLNSYFLDNSMEFKALGTNVPEEISKILCINEINFQQQLDRPFLLDSSPGEVALHFNKIAHLDVIDLGIQNVQRWLRSIEQDITSKESQLKDLQEESKKYLGLDKLDGWLVGLEVMESKKQVLKKGKEDLNKLIIEDFKITRDMKEYDKLLEMEIPVNKVLKLIEEKDTLVETKDHLIGFIGQIDAAGDELEEVKKEQIKLQKKFEAKFPDICPLCGSRKKINRMEK